MRRAFSLIELLVVIAIISVLISILLPTLGAAREAGHAAKCMSNQRQIGMALMMYTDQFNGWHPRAGNGPGELSWPYAFRPFLDPLASWDIKDFQDQYENAEYYRDPARVDDGHNIHYVNNGLRFSGPGRAAGAKPAVRMNNYKFPAQTIYLSGYANDITGDDLWDAYRNGERDNKWIGLFYDIWKTSQIIGELTELRISPNRHGNGANGLYLDGHVAHIDNSDLTSINLWDDMDYRLRIPY